ncbi:MAG: type I-E CRISPR-associated protein Cas6/Cse3/CasE [Sulfuricella sp.]|nr:type I-E CRISPR-associated protein Cas6/Cse3/CasE [Sulfuricella sp.]
MYFSVITPEEHLLRQAAHELAQSPYAEHQWLWQFFPSSADQVRDFVFRRHELEQMPRFYVVSQRPPMAFSEAWQVQSRRYDPQLQAGQHLSFQLRANPVITRKSADGKSRRHDVVMQAKKQLLAEHGHSQEAKWKDWKDGSDKPLLYELVQEHCAAWLDGVAKRNGFEIALTVNDEPQRKVQVDAYEQSKAGKRGHLIQFSTVDFSGELLVTDPELFQQALFNGLGHAKSFGCGLLLVRRP